MGHKTTIASLGFAIALLTSCGQHPNVSSKSPADSSPSPQRSATLTVDPAGNADTYFQSFGLPGAQGYALAASLAAPDSFAYAYAKYKQETIQASIDSGGYTASGKNVTKTASGYRLAYEGSATKNVFTDIRFTDGKVSSFRVEGRPIAGRISLGDGRTAPAGRLATVTFLSAYQEPSSEYLIVVVDVASKRKPILVADFGSTYRTPGGRQISFPADGSPNQQTLQPHSRAYYVLLFAGAQVGGTVTLPINSADSSERSTAKFRAPRFG